MAQQTEDQPGQIGLFLNPVGQRRVDFQASCGEQFARVFLADGAEQAAELLERQAVDLLVIDLERFEPSIDLAALGGLIAGRAGRPTLLICPFGSAGWLTALMAFGPLAYVIGPLADEALAAQVAAQLAPEGASGASGGETTLRAQMAVRDRLQQSLAELDDTSKVAEHICRALSGWPGVVRAALFLMTPGELRLEAQVPADGWNLNQLLGGAEGLLDSPMRHAFPGLLAACSGQMALLDAPTKAGQTELAIDLLDKGVQMVLGVPLPPGRLGAARGAVCLMFGHARAFSGDELHAFASLAQLAGLGLSMAATTGENAQLMGRLTHLATIDALTGVANRRHGEHLLEGEVRRARRYQVPLALIGFDIDRFRAVNDQFGHPVGDAALRTVAEAVQAGLRSSDVLVRTGGAQFAIIAPHTNATDGLRMAEKIRIAIAQADIAGCDRLTISLGVAQLAEQESADALALRAEAALGRAKRAGRNCVELAMR